MKQRRRFLWGLVFWAALGLSANEWPGDRFVFSQLRHAGAWDPYPDFWESLSPFLRRLTSVDPWETRRVVTLEGTALWDSPFLWLTGRGDPGFGEKEIGRLREYLGAGGFLVIDNTDGTSRGAFDNAAQSLPGRLWEGALWRRIPAEHAVRRAFFLLRGPFGRRGTEDLLGLWAGDRLVAVYLKSDLMGALAQDRMGQPLYSCEPGGETQRAESRKVFVNLVIFSMTGTYKTDAVHQPFLEKKRILP